MNRVLSIVIISILISFSSFAQITTGRTNPVYLNIGNEGNTIGEITITWISPKVTDSNSSQKEIEIRLGINTTSELKNITIYINDLPVGKDRGFKVVKSGEHNFDKVIEKKLILSKGANEIKVVVENENGSSAIDKRIFNFAGEVIARLERKDYAVLFATDVYKAWPDLSNPINDAKTIAKELEDHYGFEVEIVTNNTTDDILIKLREYATKSYMDNDQLLIFFAGHGQFDEIYNTGYVVGTNSKKDDVAKTSYLSHSVLRDVIDNIPSKHIFLTMDVCFGGTFDRAIAMAGSRGGDAIYDEISQEEFIQRKLKFKTRKYLTSGGKEYVPDGRPGMHSPFARKFIEALRSYGGEDKILTLHEILNYVARINPEPRFDEFGQNEPGSDFVFVAK